MIFIIYRHLEPDELAKQLGNRDLILGITSTLSYRALRKLKVIHMFRFGLETGTAVSGDTDNERSRFGMADPTSVSELRFRDIQSLSKDGVRGTSLPGVSRKVVKRYLEFRFQELEKGSFSVIGLYKNSTIIDTFMLELTHLMSLMDLQTKLFTPQGSKTTFVLPHLVKLIGEMQMKSVLL